MNLQCINAAQPVTKCIEELPALSPRRILALLKQVFEHTKGHNEPLRFRCILIKKIAETINDNP